MFFEHNEQLVEVRHAFYKACAELNNRIACSCGNSANMAGAALYRQGTLT